MPKNISILIASNNKHKASEINEIFDKLTPFKVNLLLPADVGLSGLDVEESGLTLEDNAMLKAKAFYEKSGIPSFADDTGLEIDFLNGAPGVHSARFSGVHGNDPANRVKALQLLSGIEQTKRTARFRTVICYYDGNEAVFTVGICNGHISESEKGSGGFGYDSIFVPEGYSKTFAEMTPTEKNRLSHRSKAVNSFALLLIDLLK